MVMSAFEAGVARTPLYLRGMPRTPRWWPIKLLQRVHLTSAGRVAFVKPALIPSSYPPHVGGVENVCSRLACELLSRVPADDYYKSLAKVPATEGELCGHRGVQIRFQSARRKRATQFGMGDRSRRDW